MSNLSLTNVTKRFGGFTAVKDVNLSVEPNEVLCLLGPSGCGKTTTLRMIAGLETATDGRITFGDLDVTAKPAEDRNIAMAFQFYALYPDLTVADNLVFPLDAEKPGRAEKVARLNHIAEVLQLDDVLGRYPHQLSEGEKQRVAVGRCIIRKPNAFLFDEPLSRLDVKLREEMRGSIRRILSTLDRPTVIVTHDQLEAMTMGDRIAVMRDGMIEQMGRPADVFDRPANTFIAGFIGTPQMTLLKGYCCALDGERLSLSFGDLVFDLSVPDLSRPLVVGRPVTIGFRPRAARLSCSKSDAEFKNATLTLIENMGAEWLLHFEWRGQAIRVLQPGPVSLSEGDVVAVSVSTEDLTIFADDDRRVARKGDPK